MTSTGLERLVRDNFSAFLKCDRKALDTMLSEDFTFTSPRDDHLTREEFYLVCLPGSKLFDEFDIQRIVSDSDDAFVLYSAKLKDGTRIRNTELIRTDGQRIISSEVFFGS